MEKELYQKVFEKAYRLKSAKSLGSLVRFVTKEINLQNDKSNYDVINHRTLIRGFERFLDVEMLKMHDLEKGQTPEKEKYNPSLKTLNLLSEYIGYESYSDFLGENKTVVDEENKSTKSRTKVKQYGENNEHIDTITVNGDFTIKM